MSLRWRLAVVLAVLSAVAVGAVAAVAYAATRDQLRGETDRFLRERVATLVRDRSGPRGRGDLPALVETWLPRIAVRELGPALRLDAVVQLLDRDGRVIASAGGPALPVDERDVAIARGDGTERFATTEVDGDEYRVMTAALEFGGAVQVGRDVTATERVLDRLAVRFAGIGVVLTVAAVGAGLVLARRTTRSLGELTLAAERVASTGDLSVELPEATPDEPGRLAAAMSSMLDRLAESREQQRRLVQDAGHELRTPLTSVRTNVEVLRKHGSLSEEARAQVLADLEAETRELTNLVDELVALATEDATVEEEQDVSLVEVGRRVAERADRRWSRSLVVHVAAGAGSALVRGRPVELERAVTNLVDNAVKFSDGPVEVEVGPGSVTVRDHGPGIAEEDLGHVFDRFYRSPAARGLPGSGLGLAIVRRAALHHDGHAFARNHPDGGAVVGFEVGPGRVRVVAAEPWGPPVVPR